MRNKELKKGDKVWIFCACMSYDSNFPVLRVSKKGTLVTVVVEAKHYNMKKYEMTLYGHASSSLLSGFDRRYGNTDIDYTCDYDLIREKTESYNKNERYRDAGMALLNLVQYFKD
jgi:hypothetical protein